MSHTHLFSYGMPFNLGIYKANTGTFWYNIHKEQKPSNRILYCDSIYFMTFSGINEWTHSNFITQYNTPTSLSDRTIHLRHKKGSANGAFVDGHVKELLPFQWKELGFNGGRNKRYSPVSF